MYRRGITKLRSSVVPVPFLVFLFLSLSAPSGATESFLHSRYESLKCDELQARYERPPDASPGSIAGWLQDALFHAECLGVSRRIHEEARVLREIDESCTTFQVTGEKSVAVARGLLACAMARVQLLPFGSSFGRPRRAAAVLALVEAARAAGAEDADRFYAEGRVLYLLPENGGRQVGRALLALQMLRRLRPQAHSVGYWLGRAYLENGNEQAAKRFFEAALSARDPRALAAFNGEDYFRNPELLDAQSWGIRPTLFLAPTAGFGGALSLHDDRFWDGPRGGSLVLFGSTRGTFGAEGEYRERSLGKDVTVRVELGLARAIEDFYGIGIAASGASYSRLTMDRTRAAIAIEQRFLRYLSFAIGWRLETARVHRTTGTVFGATTVRDRDDTRHTGAFGEIAFDNRDSRRAPRRGWRARVRGYFPRAELGSLRSFEQWRTDVTGHFTMGRLHGLRIGAGIEWTNGDVPYGVYPKLGESFALPGVRQGRFQDRAAAAAVAEYHLTPFSPATLFAFATVGTVAPTFSALFDSAIKAGGGGGLLFHPERRYSPTVRLELGVFASQFAIGANGGISF